MTFKQRAFVAEYIKDGVFNATSVAAARRAGYSPKTAASSDRTAAREPKKT